MKIKLILTGIIISFFLFSCNKVESSQETVTTDYSAESTLIFLTRHAEKDTTGEDPELSAKGIQRVNGLTTVLKNVDFDAIYSTNYKRTIATVKPIADINQLVIMPYEAGMDPKEFAEQLLKDEKGNKVLISGHSNTIPFIINELTGRNEYKQFDDDQYGDLFMVIINDHEKRVVRLNQPIVTE